MPNEIPFDEWLNEQGDDVRVAMCDCHPETLILVDTKTLYIYKYVQAENHDDAADLLRKFIKNRMPELGIGVTE